SNILLQPDEETGEAPKIIDFGLAKTAAPTAAPLTRAGQIVGTPQYMAPEQIARKEVDARTDVYALGSVLYAMLCGRPPFPDTGDDVQLLYRQVHEPVEPVRVHAPHVSAELEEVVLRALAKAPADRFQSAADFARALVPAVEKREPRPRSEVTEVIERPRASLSRAWWAALFVAVTLLAAAGGAWLMQRAPAGGLLILLSDPAGAEILVDGKPVGDRTPAALRGVAPGEHTVTLRHAGFNDLVRTARFDADGGRQLVDAHLLPRSHRVELSTVPPGATVFVDGALMPARTPLSFELVDGEYHAVRVEKAGYETVTRKLTPDDGGALAPIVLSPETHPRGTVYVDAAAPSAVWIDGQYSGFMTPTPGLLVGVGEHTVQLRDASGAIVDELRAHVGKGETVRLALQPHRRGDK
ncbi:MAG TPA: serine/threonine-protein kinase, partial [Polyangia bacterium]